eukprot:CAMPEP_0119061082 /NCGR_PEP_ID=MMETSP1178-20130426/4932_1 /TAXON_ID=33656 /ORGANISM="unid sp, Strain CCMP2000" /LENGTH=366 /DNA_ID=CAMNT_0007042251 /DNA_START=32 /DNA_END=1132 /DNA_ORIENTATION=-
MTGSLATKIYWTTAACTSSRQALLSRLLSRLEEHGTVLCDQPTKEENAPATGSACERRQAWMDDCSLAVAEISEASADVGAEVSYALHRRRVPTLCLIERGRPVPAMLSDGAHPLLTTKEYAGEEEAAAAIAEFVSPPVAPGRIFVIEGGDGAGKQTQSAMLRERLQAEGFPVATMDFPHDAAMHGKLIREILSGAKGGIKQVNPLLFASLYAENRHDVAPILRAWLRQGCNVILDRYMEANFGHQASKLEPAARPALIDALTRFEHDWLGLPRAHRVTYLDLPPKDALRAMAADTARGGLDIHETAGDDYKGAVRDTFVWCADNFDHWQRVPCVDAQGERISKLQLHEQLYASLQAEFVNKARVA